MNQNKVILIAALLSLINIQLVCSTEEKFTYKQNGKDWDGLCETGKKQSPINIETPATQCDNQMNFQVSISDQNFNVVRKYPTNGVEAHNIQSEIEFSKVHATMDGKINTWKAVQFHLHAPSENQINGHNFDVEMHIVHKNDEGKLAVVALLFDQKLDSSDPTKLFFSDNNFSLKDLSQQVQNFSPKVALEEQYNSSSKYYQFEGSLTTPPCSEDVMWFVHSQPFPITKEQVEGITKYFAGNTEFAEGKGNNREVQPMNGRKVRVGGVLCNTVNGNILSLMYGVLIIFITIILI